MQIAATWETSPLTGAVGFCGGLYRTPERFVLRFNSKCVYLFIFGGVSFRGIVEIWGSLVLWVRQAKRWVE